MILRPGYALLGKSMQFGVIGLGFFRGLESEKFHTRSSPERSPTLAKVITGMCGDVKFNLSAEIPVGVGGSVGVLRVHVI